MRRFILRFGPLILIVLVFVFEYLLSHFRWLQLNRVYADIEIILAALGMIWWHIRHENTLAVIKIFFNAHHGEASSIMGLLNIVFVFIQLHIIGTEVHGILVPHPGKAVHGSALTEWLSVGGYIALLFIPFLLIGYIVEKKRDIPQAEREVLVSVLSFNKADLIKRFIDTQFDPARLIAQREDGSWTSFNWYPIRKSLEMYGKINTVILLIDGRSEDEINLAGSSVETIMPEFLGSIRTGIRLEYVRDVDVEELNKMNTKTKADIEKLLKPYPNAKIVFNVTSGTSVASSAMTLFSIRGNRGLCYLKQDDPDPKKSVMKEFSVSVFDLQDVFEAFFEASENEK